MLSDAKQKQKNLSKASSLECIEVGFEAIWLERIQ
jgi:hypothetical protein